MNNEELKKEIEILKAKISALEKIFTFDGISFEEKVRDIIFYGDSPAGSLTSTTVVTSVDFGLSSVTTASLQTGTPAKFLRTYYKGKPYQLVLYSVQ